VTPLNLARLRSVRRGSSMLEFALVLPFLLIFMALVLNFSFIAITHASLQIATNNAARVSAQVGGGDLSLGNAPQVFRESVEGLPGVEASRARVTVVSGRVCAIDGPNRNVQVQTDYEARLMMPGINVFFRMVGGKDDGASALQLSARSVARCEVVR
jgi:hypothetical protein